LQTDVVDDFSDFARRAEPRLRQALCSRFGVETGREAATEAMAVAWVHGSRISTYDNPVGYRFGVEFSGCRRSGGCCRASSSRCLGPVSQSRLTMSHVARSTAAPQTGQREPFPLVRAF
jgi:hypothetical protein